MNNSYRKISKIINKNQDKFFKNKNKYSKMIKLNKNKK